MTHEQEQKNIRQRHILMAAFAVFIIVLGFYVYLVNQTVHNVVARRALEREMALLSSDIAALEEEHGILKRSVTKEYAYTLGFEEIAHVSYVTHDTLAVRDVVFDTR